MRRFNRRLIAGSAMLGVLVLIPPMAASADAPSVTVSPSSGLVDGQVVDVAWSGFSPSNPVYIRVCKRGTASSGECALPGSNNDLVQSSDQGGGVVRYQLVAGRQGLFQCSDTHACDVVVMQNPDDLSGAVRVPFSFAHPPTACPSATVQPVAGEGATSAAYTMYSWENAACLLPSHLNVMFTNDNSFDGLLNWVNSNPNSDFAVTGVPVPSDQATQLASKHRQFAYAPLTLTAVAVAYNIVDQHGHQITHLVLTPHIMAEIATGQLSSFYCPADASDSDCVRLYGSDPEIRRLNPGIDFPTGSVQFSIRAEHSATNLAFTSWLAANTPDLWTYGSAAVWPPPDPNACRACSGGIQGEVNVARSLSFPFGYTDQNVYIGVLDSTYAAINDLPMARLVDPGQPETGVAPNADSIAAAVGAATTNADGTITPDWGTSAADTYPMPLLTYAAVPTSKRWPNFTADDGKTLRDFLNYVSNANGGQQLLPAASYPLTPALVAETTAAAARIPITEPPTGDGGGHNGNGGQSGGNTGGGSFGGGGGSGGGGGTSGGGGPTPGAKLSDKTPAPPIAFTNVGAQLSSTTSGSMVPALAALALIAALIGPTLLLANRRNAVLASLARTRRPRIRPLLRRGGPPAP
ncbi:MAG: phosphate transport system substrate-binding protein [Gaiellales bacterium]|nr:phosphate transport system substrate-binding protein [Gaiellales bacterium]